MRDKPNRLDKMTQKGAPEGDLVTDHDYDQNGNEKKVVAPKGQVVNNTYDELNRPKTKTYQGLPAELPQLWRHPTRIDYSYDPNGNLLQQDESVASGTDPPSATLSIVRTFDTLDRLESETTTLPDSGVRTITYSYFANGSRQTSTDPEAGVTADSPQHEDNACSPTASEEWLTPKNLFDRQAILRR